MRGAKYLAELGSEVVAILTQQVIPIAAKLFAHLYHQLLHVLPSKVCRAQLDRLPIKHAFFGAQVNSK